MHTARSTNSVSDPQLLASPSESHRSAICACNSLRFTTFRNKGLKAAHFHNDPQKPGGGALSPRPWLHTSVPPCLLVSPPPCFSASGQDARFLRPERFGADPERVFESNGPIQLASLPPLTPSHCPRLESSRERNPQNRNGSRARRQAAQTHPSRLHPVQQHVHGHARPVRRQAVSQLPQGLGLPVHRVSTRVIFLPLARNSPVMRP